VIVSNRPISYQYRIISDDQEEFTITVEYDSDNKLWCAKLELTFDAKTPEAAGSGIIDQCLTLAKIDLSSN
jgi:hypothetical protein